jgi:hypothetical protein
LIIILMTYHPPSSQEDHVGYECVSKQYWYGTPPCEWHQVVGGQACDRPLTNYENALWYGSIEIGTPPVTFNGMAFLPALQSLIPELSHIVAFDTGSSDLFIPSSSCGDTCSGHTKYDPSASSSSKSLRRSFAVAHGAAGMLYTDVGQIGGLTVSEGVVLIFPQGANVPHYRRTRRCLVPQPSILWLPKAVISHQTA